MTQKIKTEVDTSQGGWEKEFDLRFENIYYGKDLDGFPIMPPPQFVADVKSFIKSLLLQEKARVVDFVVKEMDEILVGFDSENRPAGELMDLFIDLAQKLSDGKILKSI